MLHSSLSAPFHYIWVAAPFWCVSAPSLPPLAILQVCLIHNPRTVNYIKKNKNKQQNTQPFRHNCFLLLHCIVSISFPQNVFNAQFHYIWVVVALHHSQKTVFATLFHYVWVTTLFFSVPKNLLTTVFVVSCVPVSFHYIWLAAPILLRYYSISTNQHCCSSIFFQFSTNKDA